MYETIVSCGAVVYRISPELQILLIKQHENAASWGIPKGHMERGESQEQTALREVKEETGLTIRLVKKLESVTLKKRNFKKLVIMYLATQVCSSEPDAKNKNSEVFEARWFNVSDLPDIYCYQKPVIEEVLLLLRPAHI